MFNTLLIIPAYNEEKNIRKVIREIRSTIRNIDILVVNDGSIDNTGSIVESENCNLISLPFNLGYGAALQTGFKYACQMGYSYVVQFDGDGQHDASDINIIMDRLKTTSCDIVIGSRFMGKGDFRLGFMKEMAIKIFRLVIRIFTGVKISDPTSGLQGLSRSVFSLYSNMGHFPGDYPDADILIYMIRSDFKVSEFPANIRMRETGKSMHSGLKPIIYFAKIFLSIIVVLFREKAVRRTFE